MDDSHTNVALQDMQIYMKPVCKWGGMSATNSDCEQ